MKRRDTGRLVDDLARLPSLTRAELIECWEKIYGIVPPGNISRSLMLRALAYRMQELASRGLKPATRRHLQRLAEGNGPSIRPVAQVKTGTRLLREWHGVTHEVLVKEDGVFYRGNHYRSLSQVAQVITGAKWSGPLFFGLKKEAA